MRKNAALTKQCEKIAKGILAFEDKTEHELLKSLQSFGFTGYTIKRGKFATVYAEIFSVKGNARGKMGWIYFDVPTCRTFYKRDKKGRIINIEYFAK